MENNKFHIIKEKISLFPFAVHYSEVEFDIAIAIIPFPKFAQIDINLLPTLIGIDHHGRVDLILASSDHGIVEPYAEAEIAPVIHLQIEVAVGDGNRDRVFSPEIDRLLVCFHTNHTTAMVSQHSIAPDGFIQYLHSRA